MLEIVRKIAVTNGKAQGLLEQVFARSVEAETTERQLKETGIITEDTYNRIGATTDDLRRAKGIP